MVSERTAQLVNPMSIGYHLFLLIFELMINHWCYRLQNRVSSPVTISTVEFTALTTACIGGVQGIAVVIQTI
jgi:hypothetical protein